MMGVLFLQRWVLVNLDGDVRTNSLAVIAGSSFYAK